MTELMKRFTEVMDDGTKNTELSNKMVQDSEEFKAVQKRIEKAFRELNLLWGLATDEEKTKLKRYFTK